MLAFLKEYSNWKKDHRQEIQESKLRREALKTPLNYALLDQLFMSFTNQNKDVVMEIDGKDFKIKLYWDQSGNFQRKTTTERILDSYKGVN